MPQLAPREHTGSGAERFLDLRRHEEQRADYHGLNTSQTWMTKTSTTEASGSRIP